ncbi:ornithine cyclodeaminase [Dactylosporangium sp. NPDC050588]|uniref:ornithine cyclodeaminase n=1 Tax=Dactylosporangium sp. NPDC050588 TaxID=3157211 RepID=UPI0033F4A06A
MIKDDELLYLSLTAVIEACVELDPVATVYDTLVLHARDEVRMPDEAYLGWRTPDGAAARSLNMPAHLGGEIQALGTKIINSNPDNIKRDMPRASGLTVLFDPATARPLCVMEATHISALRTAAVSFVAARAVWASEPQTVAVFGAGPIARTHIELLVPRAPRIKQLFLYDLDRGRTEALARDLAPLSVGRDLTITVVTEPVAALAAATLVIAATSTTTPYIGAAHLKPGTVVVNVSLDDVDAGLMLSADRLYVDDWGLICADQHRLLGRMARDGRISGPGTTALANGRAVDGTIGQLLLGTCPSPAGVADSVVINPFGMAIHDISLARQVYSVAIQRGLGHRLPR